MRASLSWLDLLLLDHRVERLNAPIFHTQTGRSSAIAFTPAHGQGETNGHVRGDGLTLSMVSSIPWYGVTSGSANTIGTARRGS